jgi:hypothetical protein
MQQLTPEDRAQVKAILLTHAEMQDQMTLQSEGVLGRLKHDEPEAVDMIQDLEDSIEDCTEDSENLKRLANKF